jgi:hypothetical protein
MDKRQLGGIGLLIGNLAIMLNGLAAQKSDNIDTRKSGKQRIAAGAAWSGGALLLARYGAQPVSRQTERLEHKLAAYLKRENIPLDVETLRKADEEQRRAWFSKIEDFLYTYPIECDNAYNIVANTAMIRSGQFRKDGGENAAGNMNMAFGTLGLISSLISIFVPEKTPEQIAEAGQAGTFLGKIQEKPLVYALGFSLVSTIAEGIAAKNEYKTAKNLAPNDPFRPYAFAMSALTAVATALYIVSDWLTDTGEKRATGKVEERTTAQQQIIAEASRILKTMPKDQRHKTVHKVAVYLAEQPELRMVDFNAQKLAAKLMNEMEAQEAQQHSDTAEHPENSAPVLHVDKIKYETPLSANTTRI